VTDNGLGDEARPVWLLKFKDREYRFDPQQQLTMGRLRQIKSWYGVELGRYLSFLQAFSQLDPDAVACAIWVCRKAEGESNVPEPTRMEDFALGEALMAVESVGGDVDPTSPEEPGPQEDQPLSMISSTEIPTDSGSGISGS
jgi:hypothetical protein